MTSQSLFGKLALLALLGTVTTLFGGALCAQDKDKDKVKDKDGKDVKEEVLDFPRAKKTTLIRSGYCRPGNPNDVFKDGKLIEIAWDDEYKDRYLGATVYFAVYERSGPGDAGDVFGTGMPGIDDMFKEGRGTNGIYSPAFDVSAKYLYVYQVVNDRGLDPKKEIPVGAAFREFRTEDIVSATVKLLVEPCEITSWGHFNNTAFVARVPDRDLRGQEVLAADGKNERMLLMALSSNPAILEQLPYKEYTSIAPALSLHQLRNGFGTDKSNLNLSSSKATKDLAALKEKGVKLVSWQENMLTATKGGMEPAFVELVAGQQQSYGPMVMDGYGWMQAPLLGVGKNPARGYLKADWRAGQVLKLGEHSVVFGFTSNLPPVDEVVRVISAAKEGKSAVKAVALVDAEGVGVGIGQVAAPGTVPTPAGGGFAAPATGGFGAWMGGQSLSGGGGFSGGIGGAGNLLTPTPFVASGGGGNNNGTPAAAAATGTNPNNGNNNNSQTGQQSGSQNQTLTNTITITNTNQQAQAQAQFQQQQQQQQQRQNQNQNQHQNQNNNNNNNVVPEPAAFALAALGLPALVVLLRRRKRATVTATAS
jgi:hypothetical protein